MAKRGGSKVVLTDGAADDAPPLSAAQIRELRRRVKDIDDRTRYLLVSKFTPSFSLYYNVSDDTYVMNEPSSATLFKRRAAANAVQKLLGRGVQIVRCRVDRSGALVTNSLHTKFRVRRLKE